MAIIQGLNWRMLSQCSGKLMIHNNQYKQLRGCKSCKTVQLCDSMVAHSGVYSKQAKKNEHTISNLNKISNVQSIMKFLLII